MRVVLISSKNEDVVTRTVVLRLEDDGHEVVIGDDEKLIKHAEVIVLDLRGEGVSRAREVVKVVEKSDQDKLVIGLSTLMSWRNTDKDCLEESKWDQRVPTETDRGDIYKAENFVLEANSESLRSVVIGFGLVYGSGEGILEPYFKTMWTQGENAVLPIPSWNGGGEAKNVIPSIHAEDLASLVSACISKTRSDFKFGTTSNGEYIVAVDESHNSVSDIVRAISQCFNEKSSCKVMSESDVQKALIGMGTTTLDCVALNPTLLLDMSFRSFSACQIIEQAGFEWRAKEGLVKHIELCVSEWCDRNALTPIRVLVLGTPCSGKSSVSKILASRLGLECLDVDSVVRSNLETLENVEEESSELKSRLMDELRGGKKKKKIDLDSSFQNRVSVSMLRDLCLEEIKKQQSSLCRLGWVMDGVVSSAEDVKLLLAENKICPDVVVVLESEDSVCTSRASSMSSEEIISGQNDAKSLKTRLASFRAHTMYIDPNKKEDDEGVVKEEEEKKGTKKSKKKKKKEEEPKIPAVRLDSEDFWNDMLSSKSLLLRLDVSEMSLEDVLSFVSESMISTYQRARPARFERDAEKEFVAVIEKCENQNKNDEENKEESDEKEATVDEEEIQHVLKKCAPLNEYLDGTVLPLIALGLDKVVRERPEDPVKFLANYMMNESVRPCSSSSSSGGGGGK